MQSGIKMSRANGWRTMWKDDGVDYPAILAGFRASGDAEAEYKNDGRTGVFKTEAAGRPYIIKHYLFRDPRLEKRIYHRLAGSFYSRIFRIIQRAVANGCRDAQEVYLVTERFEGGEVVETWLVEQFIEGTLLVDMDYRPLREKVLATMARIHRCGLSSGDAHVRNFIETPGGEVKLIDVSIHSPVLVSQMKDAIQLRNIFGDASPFAELLLPTPFRRCLFRLIVARDWARNTLRVWQGKRGR